MQRSIAVATMDTMDTMATVATMDTALLGFGCLWRCATLNNLAAIQGTCGGSLPYRTPVFVNASVQTYQTVAFFKRGTVPRFVYLLSSSAMTDLSSGRYSRI